MWDLLTWIDGTQFAETIRISLWIFPALEIAHVAAIALVLGSIARVDLRLFIHRPRGPLGDPAFDEIDLLGGQRFAIGRHPRDLFAGAHQRLEQQALATLAGDDRVADVAPFECRVATIEPQAGLLFARSVTLVAMLGEQRLNVAREVDRFGGGRNRNEEQQAEQSGAHGGKLKRWEAKGREPPGVASIVMSARSESQVAV